MAKTSKKVGPSMALAVGLAMTMALAVLPGARALGSYSTTPEGEMKKLTPMVFVERVEPCLAFWEQLGFERSMEVPGEDGLVFATLTMGPVEVMYQTLAVVVEDLPVLANDRFGQSSFFIEVESLRTVQAAVAQGGHGEVLVQEKVTFYGSTEMVVRAPCGTVVVFAEMGDQEGES